MSLRRRSAIEPMIGHLKSDGLLERNRLAGTRGDAINAILAAAGHNLRLILAWLRRFCVLILIALFGSVNPVTRRVISRPQGQISFFHGRLLRVAHAVVPGCSLAPFRAPCAPTVATRSRSVGGLSVTKDLQASRPNGEHATLTHMAPTGRFGSKARILRPELDGDFIELR
jgi:hypothetical protein